MRSLYEKLVPYETRFWLYKFRHPAEFQRLRTIVYESPKGNFSLRAYDQKQCIFVHITKSAGTSIAKSLFGELPYHYTARQYRVIFGRKTFNQYFKFAFVRNPWDRLHSAFSYLKNGGWNENDKMWAEKNIRQLDNLNDFVIHWLNRDRLHSHIHFWPQMDFVADNSGRPLIDDLAYFETIEEDYERLAIRIGAVSPLAHVNASRKVDYREAYSPDAIEKVGELYASDVQSFGYTFDKFNRRKIKCGRFVSATS
jgi:hypothetical protein